MLAAALLAACASPDPKLYTLVGTPPSSAPLPLATPLVVEIRRAGIPSTIDRPEIVRSAADYRVHLAKNERWSEPLGDLLQQVLTEDVTRRLPGSTVYSDAGSISADPTRTIEVDFNRLESDGAGLVVLDAQFSVQHPGSDVAATTRTAHITAPIASPATADYAAAMSTALGRLADAVVASIGP